MRKRKRKQNRPDQPESPIKLDKTVLGSGIRMPKKKTEYDDFPSFLRAYVRHFRRYIVTGLLVWVPTLVTLWVTWWFVTNVGGGVNEFMRNRVDDLHNIADRIPALSILKDFEYKAWYGFLFAILLFLTTGFLARYIAGRQLISALDTLIGNIPLINKVYVAVQQIRDVFVGRDGAVFEEVVLLEYPRKGIHAVGFVTSRERGIVQETAGLPLVAVFVPTTPNPTSGFLLYLPPGDVQRIDITVEDAMKLIVSGGAFIPGQPSRSIGDDSEGWES